MSEIIYNHLYLLTNELVPFIAVDMPFLLTKVMDWTGGTWDEISVWFAAPPELT